MNFIPTSIPDVIVIEPEEGDVCHRSFLETHNQQQLAQMIGRDVDFVQGGELLSTQAQLHGLHYQIDKPQGRLHRVSVGEVFDVAVDIRHKSPTFGQWVGERLSGENKRQLWIPEGFAHGFLVLSDYARFHYKVTDYCCSERERCIRYDDPVINIAWPVIPFEFPVALCPVLSENDKQGMNLTDVQLL